MSTHTVPTDRTMVRRLCRMFDTSSVAEMHAGLWWYRTAHNELARYGSLYGYDTAVVTGITAALSPVTSWPDNVRKTAQVLETGDTYGLSRSRTQAQAILAGSDPDAVLTGPKVRAFWSNLSDPDGSDAVTIDRHAFDAAVGHQSTDPERKAALYRVGGYDRFANVYRAAAQRCEVAPHALQSVVWLAWRNRTGRFHYQKLSAA